MNLGLIIITSIFCVMGISTFAYLSWVKYLSFNRRYVIAASIANFIATYVIMIGLSRFAPEKLTIIESILYSGVIFIIIFFAGFPAVEESFKKAYYHDKIPNHNCYNDCSDVAEYFDYPRKVMIVAIMHKVGFYGFFTSLILVFICRKMYGIDMNNEAYGWIYYVLCIFPALCLFCMAFLRLVVKCPNCECSLFPVTQDLDAFFTIPKRVIKDKAIDCMVCSATYALDPKIDLEELRRDKKKRIEDGTFIPLGPDGRKREGTANKT